MRSSTLLFILASALLCFGCGASNQSNSVTGSQSTTNQTSQSTPARQGTDGPPVSVAHGSPPPAGGPSDAPDTAALDKKIDQAEAKAKASGAPADKVAAAAAYLERGNIFYSASKPALYKFALRDFRIALRFDPSNAEARAKQDQIVEIYKSMGRPVPDLGNEP